MSDVGHPPVTMEQTPLESTKPQTLREQERLLEEINVLRLEGRLFCFDPKEARRRSGELVFDNETGERRVVIDVHPSYGQPSVLAYRILQAIFKKITDEGFPISDTVSFSQRELARLTGQTSFGGRQSQQMIRALRQLHRTGISASLLSKETKQWVRLDFVVIPKMMTSGRGSELHECVVQVEGKIIESLNQRHWACFNWGRLQTLEPIGMAIYKRLYRHFSNLYDPKKAVVELKFEKDYEDILAEWLGGLRPEPYASQIKRQLAPHLNAILNTRLIRRWDVVKKADGSGYKLTFWPGKGFFEDYGWFYNSQWQPRLRFVQAADHRNIQQPHELVARFHTKLGHAVEMFDAKEVQYASTLLDRFPYDAVADLVDYSIAEAAKTLFEMRFLTAIKQYVPGWERERENRQRANAEIAARKSCTYCGGSSFVRIKPEHQGQAGTMMRCPHDPEQIAKLLKQYGSRLELPRQ